MSLDRLYRHRAIIAATADTEALARFDAFLAKVEANAVSAAKPTMGKPIAPNRQRRSARQPAFKIARAFRAGHGRYS